MIFKIALRHIFSKPILTVFTIAAMASTLSILGVFWTVVENLERVRVAQSSAQVQGVDVGVSLFLDSKAPEAEISELKSKLSADNRFDKFEVINSKEALERLERQFGPGFSSALQGDSLPLTVRLSFANESMTRDEYVSLMNELRTYPNVLDVDDGLTLGANKTAVAKGRIFTWANALLVMIFAIVALLVSHLIRIAFESLKTEVETMKVLGASPFWIFKPLLIEGAFFGISGAVVSLGILAIGVRVILPQFGAYFLPKGVEIQALSFYSSLGIFTISLLASLVGACFTFPLVSRPPREF